MRAYLAQKELSQVVPIASEIKAQVVAGDVAGASAAADRIAQHTTTAAELTSDPIWRAGETLPWVGANLRVVRELAAAGDEVAQNGVVPLTTLTGTIGLSSFKPQAGHIDLQPIVDAQPTLASASASLAQATADVDSIDVGGTLAQVSEARIKLKNALTEASNAVSLIESASRLIPSMLGHDGPRNYLVLFQNNAELRSTGGIPGAMAVVSTNGGSLALTAQASSRDFPKFEAPVIDLPVETRAIYGENTAQYIQDVTFTPNFSVSGQIAREMWKERFGLEVDGVVSLDPVALSYLLAATGPITLPTGDVLTSENAVQLLLQDVYSRYQEPVEQDVFFASAAAAVFEKVAGGELDATKLVDALGHAADERRVLLWSAHPDDQAILADSSLSGSLPMSSSTSEVFGVYFNDATAAKMDPYLDVSVSTGQNVCRKDGLPNYSVNITLTNSLLADSVSSLPDYVTGGGVSGAPVGSIRTNVSVYGAPGLYNLGALRDDVAADYHPASDEGYTLSKLQVELAPGESTTLEFQFLGDVSGSKEMLVEHTPLVYSIETKDVEFSCESALQ
ncbi:DUF4012 domain-containing protein [Agreia sp. Leaf244]|uniref:DUF4012 domain-containing protein n=1 Tax=Agreia sp. Leaf244 TaxID=1736305 RepID=UPI00138EFEE0|nr:DUF4012 domain-containing protein [Agreia sp. Leaf244]